MKLLSKGKTISMRFPKSFYSDKMRMNPRIEDVVADQDFTLLITFNNGEKKRFDVKPYLDTGIFNELKEPEIFYSVKPFM